MARKALGRGLEALMQEASTTVSPPPRLDRKSEPGAAGGGPESPYAVVDIEAIVPNPDQPRENMEPERLKELSDSIAAQGVLQPLLVCHNPEGGYILIAGERRWQASKLAGLKEVPVVIKEVTGSERLALALIENVQRQDLNVLEEAVAYSRLIGEHGLTQAEVAKAVGKDRATVANLVRLLKLPDPVKGDLIEGRLSMGHARTLIPLVENEPLLLEAREQILGMNLTVRQTEKLVERLKSPRPAPSPAPAAVQLKAEEDRLRRHLGTKVAITKRGKRGRIVIEFYSEEELDRLLGTIGRD